MGVCTKEGDPQYTQSWECLTEKDPFPHTGSIFYVFLFLIHSENRTEKFCQIKSCWDLEANSFQLVIYINL